MINKWEDFKKIHKRSLNEDVNYRAMEMCGYYRVDENQMSFILHDLASNKIMCTYDPDKNIAEIETFEFEEPYNIILKNGGDKLSFALEGIDYEHDCILLRSKPIHVPDGFVM